ncbi:MAG: hypothetical protein PHY34_02480, partial [Patescibacteria group bacterium]|nr:hypothetical protein [Patescibacteria group bacterium]
GSFENEMYTKLMSGQHKPEMRQMQSRHADVHVGQFFDTPGNLVTDEEEAFARGFRPYTNNKGEQKTAAQALQEEWMKMQDYNQPISRAFYNIKYNGRVDAPPKGDKYPGDPGFIRKARAEADDYLQGELLDRVNYDDVTAAAELNGADITKPRNQKAMLGVLEDLHEAQYAARMHIPGDAMIPHEMVQELADKTGKKVDWDPKEWKDGVSDDEKQELTSNMGRVDEALRSTRLSNEQRAKLEQYRRSLTGQMNERKGEWTGKNGASKDDAHQLESQLMGFSEDELKGSLKKKMEGGLVAADGTKLPPEKLEAIVDDLVVKGRRDTVTRSRIVPFDDFVRDENVGPLPRMREEVSAETLSRSHAEYNKYKESGLSAADYDTMYEDEITAGEMVDSDELERRAEAGAQADVKKMRGLKSAVASGKSAKRQGKNASNATMLGLDFSDPAVREQFGIVEGQIAARFDSDTEAHKEEKGQMAEKLATALEQQLRSEGVGDDEIADQVGNLKKTLGANDKIVLADNNAWESRIQSIRGHELRGHDLAKNFVNLETGTMNEVGEEFYKTLSEEQQQLVDRIGMMEFAAESLGVGEGKYQLGSDSKQFLQDKKLDFFEKGVKGAAPEPESADEFIDKDFADEAVSDRELAMVGMVARGKYVAGRGVEVAGDAARKVKSTAVNVKNKVKQKVPELWEASHLDDVVEYGIVRPAKLVGRAPKAVAQGVSSAVHGTREWWQKRKYGKRVKKVNDLIDNYSEQFAENDVAGKRDQKHAAKAHYEEEVRKRDGMRHQEKQAKVQIAENNEKARDATRRAGGLTGAARQQALDEASKHQLDAFKGQQGLKRLQGDIDRQNAEVEKAQQARSQADLAYAAAVEDDIATMGQLRQTFEKIAGKLSPDELEEFKTMATEGLEASNLGAITSATFAGGIQQHNEPAIAPHEQKLAGQQAELATLQEQRIPLQHAVDDIPPTQANSLRAAKLQGALEEHDEKIEAKEAEIIETQQTIGEIQSTGDAFGSDAKRYQAEARAQAELKNAVNKRAGAKPAPAAPTPTPTPAPTTPRPQAGKAKDETLETAAPRTKPPTAEEIIGAQQQVIAAAESQLAEAVANLKEKAGLSGDVDADGILKNATVRATLEQGGHSDSVKGIEALAQSIADERTVLEDLKSGTPVAGPVLGSEQVQQNVESLGAIGDELRVAIEQTAGAAKDLPAVMEAIQKGLGDLVTTMQERMKALGESMNPDQKKASEDLTKIVESMRQGMLPGGPQGGVLGTYDPRLMLYRLEELTRAMRDAKTRRASEVVDDARRASTAQKTQPTPRKASAESEESSGEQPAAE